MRKGESVAGTRGEQSPVGPRVARCGRSPPQVEESTRHREQKAVLGACEPGLESPIFSKTAGFRVSDI